MGKEQLPPNLNEMVDEARKELEDADAPVVVRNVTRERVRELTETLIHNFALVEPHLDAELSKARADQRRAQLDGIRRWSWVFYGADVQAAEVLGASRATELAQLSERVAGHDRKLMKWARPLFDEDPVLAATLDDISPGTGRRDSAEDVLRLAKMYRDDWPRIAAMKVIGKDELAAAEADATRQLELLGNTAEDPTRILARRAYSRWYGDYTALRRTGRYLVEREADGVALFPGIGPARGGGSASKSTDTSVDEAQPQSGDAAE